MGWTCSYKAPKQSVAEFLANQFNGNTDTYQHEVLDCAVVVCRTAYLAVKFTSKPSGASFVYGMVTLLEHYNEPLHQNFCWKEMEELEGPYKAECPERILRQLTSLDDPSYAPLFNGVDDDNFKLNIALMRGRAEKWREDCWANIVARKKRPTLTKGLRLRHSVGVKFKNGQRLHDFVVLNPRTLVVEGPGGHRYKLSRKIIAACEVGVQHFFNFYN